MYGNDAASRAFLSLRQGLVEKAYQHLQALPEHLPSTQQKSDSSIWAVPRTEARFPYQDTVPVPEP